MEEFHLLEMIASYLVDVKVSSNDQFNEIEKGRNPQGACAT